MTLQEKVEWAKRAFEKIARECEKVSRLNCVDTAEQRTWMQLAQQARRNAKILGQE